MDRTKLNKIIFFTTTITGAVLITALFISYNRFLKPEQLGTGGPEPTFLEQLMERFNKPKDEEGQIDEFAASDVRTGTEEVAGTNTDSTGQKTWVATNYNNGDIKSGTYSVKQGDTLWEIAEAVYGNGAEWHKILEANKDKVGYLPNGSQALIVTGQTLIIP